MTDLFSHYADVWMLRDNPSLSPTEVRDGLHGALHEALTTLGLVGAIAVSYPGYRIDTKSLGDTLRLFGSTASLIAVLDFPAIVALAGTVYATAVQQTPPESAHRGFSRVRRNASLACAARRRAKRHGETVERATAVLTARDGYRRSSSYPVVMLDSRSTGQRYDVAIKMGPVQSGAGSGAYDSFGLAHGDAAAPWF